MREGLDIKVVTAEKEIESKMDSDMETEFI